MMARVMTARFGAGLILPLPTKFHDPLRIVTQDRRRDYGEDRFQVIGTINERTYVVVYTMRGMATRIISARKANTREIRNYEHNARQS